MRLVIVESPSKAKSINKYLGKDYKVVASYGHIRQLPSKNGSVDPKENFKMTWEETTQAKKHLKEISGNIKDASEIYLATDPDREGEAISWHIVSYLKDKKLLKNIPVKRVVFNSITKENILKAFENSRQIDENLVSAYLARLSLDYLVGFGISPILWRKLPGSKSAGRVQSVALKIICEREEEIEKFVAQEYWSVAVDLLGKKETISTKLVKFNNKALEKFSIKNEKDAEEIKKEILKNTFTLSEIENKTLTKNPFAPFTTSTLQQDAFNKIGFSAKKTMQIAQKLYEGIKLDSETTGLITYMRTDATQIDPAFLNTMRNFISSKYGENYLSKSARIYKTKAKNAQEAHEAIRPTDANKTPESIKKYLSDDEYKLYDLIYKRTLASQMESAMYDLLVYNFNNKNNDITLKASGSALKFDGFYKLYKVQNDDDEDLNNILPKMNQGEVAEAKNVNLKQHFSEPPARYSEASLVKKLEELGIGRPSTYASIINVLLSREYVIVDKKRFLPEPRGRLLNIFLNNFFTKYVEYNFTADMEKSLDAVSSGEEDYLKVLNNFWVDFNDKTQHVAKISNIEILDKINENALNQFVKDKKCPKCNEGSLQIKTSKFGPFIGCSNYPTCNYTHQLISSNNDNNLQTEEVSGDTIILGKSNNNYDVLVKKGPYGYYVEESSAPPKRTSLPKNINHQNLSLENALFLLDLPKKLGKNNDNKEVSVAIGKFGPYIKIGTEFFALKEDIFTITLNKAIEIANSIKEKKDGMILGKHPESKKDIILKSGKYGIYLVYNNENIKVPSKYKTIPFSDFSLNLALDIINNAK